MQDQATAPSNQPCNPSAPDATPVYAWRGWRSCTLITSRDEDAYDAVDVIFGDRKPLLAKEVYDDLRQGLFPPKTVVCPIALKMGIKKVKRRSGWWWVPPGVRPPTLWATATAPWAAEPTKKQ